MDLIDVYAACSSAPYREAFVKKYGAYSPALLICQCQPVVDGYQRYEWSLPPYTRDAPRLFVVVPVCLVDPCILCCPAIGYSPCCPLCFRGGVCEHHFECLAALARGEQVYPPMGLRGINPLHFGPAWVGLSDVSDYYTDD